MRLIPAVVLLAVAGCASHPVAPEAPIPPTPPLALDAALSQRLEPAKRVLDSAIAAGAAPGAVLAVSLHGERWIYSTGQMGVGDPAKPNAQTLYDMASLTKVIALTTMTMMAIGDHQIVLDSPVVHYLPQFAATDTRKASITVRNLLLHDSGLPPDPRKFFDTPRDTAVAEALRIRLDTVPGARMVYSDVGAITLMAILEHQYGERFDKLFRERFVRSMGFTRMRYLPPKSWLAEIAPTENDTILRHRVVRGDVHDENAYQMAGVSGHAGLFSDAEDLLRFGEWALAGAKGEHYAGALQPLPEFASWTLVQNTPPGSSRGLGWDTPSSNGSSAGRFMSARSFGHTGFTGTSIWIDPDRQMFVVLLTNRVHAAKAKRPSKVIMDVRNDLSDAAALAVMDDPGGVLAMPALFRADVAEDWNRPLRARRTTASSARARRAAAAKAAAAKKKGTSAKASSTSSTVDKTAVSSKSKIFTKKKKTTSTKKPVHKSSTVKKKS